MLVGMCWWMCWWRRGYRCLWVWFEMTAEPPVPPPDKNPFSFKNFVSRRVQGEDEDVIKVKKAPKKAKGKHTDPAVPFPEVGDPKNGEDNPFSFKKFASKQSQRKRAEGSSSDSEGGEDHTYNLLAKKMPESASTEQSPKSQHPKSEPFGITPRGARSDSESSTEGGPVALVEPLGPIPLVTANVPPPPLVIAADTSTIDDDESSDDQEEGPLAPPPILRLASEPSAELLMELSKLRAENEELKRNLEKAMTEAQKEKKVNTTLKKKIKNLEKKEAEDTKALADMVQKVEENLVLSATRAATAESTIGKLKQEILSLQVQLAQANPANIQRHYEEILGGVREKTAYASQRLMVAAQNADRSVRDLMSGVETLKNIAEVMEFVDRIAVVKQA